MSGRLARVWTCRACLHQQRQQVRQGQQQRDLRQAFTGRAILTRNWSSSTARRAGNSGVGFGDTATAAVRGIPRGGGSSGGGGAGAGARTGGGAGGRRKRVVWAAVGTAGGAAAVVTAFGDDVKYFAQASQRSARVVSTLAMCINDYRTTLKHEHENPEDAEALLKACHKRCAQRTLVALEKNGSIFIKLGQHLSSLNYLLPSEWCDTFIPLQDKCPVSSMESIREMVLQDTGQTLEEFFEEFEELPIGAASLAQVHRAKVRGTGQRVAVKVQHPTLDEWAPLDLALTRFTFVTLKKWFPEYDLTWLSKELELSLPIELDFNMEAENAVRAREYFANRYRYRQLVIPKVLWAKRRILVMDYVTGHRIDDLAYLDASGIDRDEVSATLARIFNEMIFGRNAPLHCDPHAGNIAIRHNASRGKGGFDIILYDHGLYRDIPTDLRRSYAKLWLAVIEADENRMREYAGEIGIENADFELFASAITGREYNVVKNNITRMRTTQEKDSISNALGDGMLAQLVQLLGKVPRVMLLILKTNDLTRALDDSLQTRQGPVRTFLILARYASRAVLDEQMEKLRGSLWQPANLWAFLQAWGAYARVGIRLSTYELYISARRVLGMQPLEL